MPKSFYDRLFDLCREHGFSISNISQNIPDVKVSPASISFWRTGSVPKPDTLNKIADYFGVTTDWLLHGDAQNSQNVIAGDGNVIGNGNIISTCTEQEQALLDTFRSLDVYQQAELLLYARKIQRESGNAKE